MARPLQRLNGSMGGTFDDGIIIYFVLQGVIGLVTMPTDWIDFTPDLAGQSWCTRLVMWPCQCGLALSNACATCDVDGCCKVLWCCPVRRTVLCGMVAVIDHCSRLLSVVLIHTSIHSAEPAAPGARLPPNNKLVLSMMNPRPFPTRVSLKWNRKRGDWQPLV